MRSLVRTREQPTGASALWFAPDGWVPNNKHLPVLLYRNAISSSATDWAAEWERLFAGNGWPPQWRNGIYAYHHYHSTAHEVLGMACGRADVLVGGPHGERVGLRAGDCVLLPAGTGHCLVEASRDLLVVGAYPAGQAWDLRRDALSPAENAAMERLPPPHTDPLKGCPLSIADI